MPIRSYQSIVQALVTPSSGPPPSGLGDEKLWLCPSLDDSADDISGNGYNGTYVGSMGTTPDTGEGGVRAYQFNGSTQYINNIGPQATWDFMNQTGVFSLAAWVKNDVASPGSQQTVISTNYDSVAVGWGLYYNLSNGLRFDLARGVGGSFSASVFNSTLTGNNVWQHVLVTGDGSHLRMYMDGVLVDTTAIIALTTGTQSNVLSVGSYVGASLLWDGLIDDVRIFDRTITQNEINWISYQRAKEDAALVPIVGIKNLTASGSQLSADLDDYFVQPEFSGYTLDSIDFKIAEDASGTNSVDDTQTSAAIWTETTNSYYKCIVAVSKTGEPVSVGESDWTHVRDIVPSAWTGMGGEASWISFSNVSDNSREQVSGDLLSPAGSPLLIADTTHGGQFALEAGTGRLTTTSKLSDVPQQDRFHISFWYKWYSNDAAQPTFVGITEDSTGLSTGQSRQVYDISSSTTNAGWYCGKQTGGNAFIQGIGNTTMTPLNEWNHVVAEFHAGTATQAMRWWINGALQDTTESASGYLGYLLQRASQPWEVSVGGTRWTTNYVDADIDDMRVWINYPLTTPHYASLYRGRGYNGRPGKVEASFRNTNSYVDNPLGSYFVAPSDTYSSRNGHGWSAAIGAANRISTVDSRLAGLHFTAGNGVYYRYDLPNGPGTYKIHAAMFDNQFATLVGYSFNDGVGGPSLHDWTGTRVSIANAVDINGDEHTPADFFANETGIEVTFTSDHLAVTRNTSLVGGNGAISWLSVEPVVEAPTFNPAWAQPTNNSIIGYF